MAASASNTGMPSAAKSLAVSLLPIPIEPVRPITNGSGPGTQHLHQRLAQGGRDLGLDGEESFERRRRLMHQHPQTIDGFVTARGSILQQLGFQRAVNDVADRRSFR